jgi:hypothetical protein
MSRLPETKKTKVNVNNTLYPTLLDRSEGFTQLAAVLLLTRAQSPSGVIAWVGPTLELKQ